MTRRAVKVPRSDADWEAELSAWSWRGVVMLIVGAVMTQIAMDPSVLPYGTELWPQAMLEVVRAAALGGALWAVWKISRVIGALTILLGARALVSVEVYEETVTIRVSRVLGRSRRLTVPTGDTVVFYEHSGHKYEHRGKVIAAHQLCDWQLGTSSAVVSSEVPWRFTGEVVATLVSAVEPSPLVQSAVPITS